MGISRVAEGRALARLLAVDLKIGLGCEGATCVEIKILRRVRIVASSSTPSTRRLLDGLADALVDFHTGRRPNNRRPRQLQHGVQTANLRTGPATAATPLDNIRRATSPQVHQVIVVHHLGPLERHGDGRVEGRGHFVRCFDERRTA